MFKVLFTIISLSLTTSAFASEKKLEIIGCSFLTHQYYKGKMPTYMTWSQGFDVENRQGWGLPTTKQSNVSGESYVGRVDLDKEGTKFEVVVSTDGAQKLIVNASVKKTTNGKVEVLAADTRSGQVADLNSSDRVMVSVNIQNKLVTAILDSDKTVKDPMDSALFPKNKIIFGSAEVYCNAIPK